MDPNAMSSDQKVGATQASKVESSTAVETAEPYIDPVLEGKVLAKFDRWVLPQFAIMNLIVYIDRSNIGNANVFGYPESLGLIGNQFGNLTTLFYVTYVLFEVPWTIGVKRFGLNKIVAISFVSFGLVTLGHGFAKDYSQAMACRLLLGLFEAGAAPAISFFISTVYPRELQSKRMAIIYISSALSGAFGGLIAYGIQQMGERRGLEAWRWLFIIEGVMTIVIFALCWFSLPRTAEDAWFLTPAERHLMLLRKERDIVYKGGDDKFQWRFLLLVAKDPMVWIAAISLFGAGVCLFGFATFLPAILTGQGYTSLQANYLSIPVYLWAALFVTGMTWLSDRLKKRAVVAAAVPIPVMIGYSIAIGTTSHAAGYFAMYLCACLYAYNTLMVTWVANNLKPDYKRSIGLAFFFSIANISGAIAGQIYPASTKPRYIMGNSVSLAMEAMALAGVGLLLLLFRSRDSNKEKLAEQGITDNGKEGDQAMNFRYIL